MRSRQHSLCQSLRGLCVWQTLALLQEQRTMPTQPQACGSLYNPHVVGARFTADLAAGGNENVDLTTVSFDDTSPDNGTMIGNLTVRTLALEHDQHRNAATAVVAYWP